MKFPSKTRLLPPLLALGLALALAAPGLAQDDRGRGPAGPSATLRVSFGGPLHWAAVDGTRVEELPAAERPDFDMFRYGGTYYAYDNNRWYSSPTERGDFTGVDERSLPSEFSTVPREHWRRFPTGWQDRRDLRPERANATFQVDLGRDASWRYIRGSRVQQVRGWDRPRYDMFRFNGGYYVYDNHQWYTSRRGNGQFYAVGANAIPSAVYRVPRDRWLNYPGDWNDRNDGNGRRRYSENDNRNR